MKGEDETGSTKKTVKSKGKTSDPQTYEKADVNSAIIVEPPTMNPDTLKETADNKLIVKAAAKKSSAKISQLAKKTADKKLVTKKSTAKASKSASSKKTAKPKGKTSHSETDQKIY
jgi:hypothetical protein